MNLPKVESLLKHFESKNSIVPGKITVGDLTILALYMASQYFKIEEDFKNLVPSAKAGFQIGAISFNKRFDKPCRQQFENQFKPIVMNLMKNKKLVRQVEQGKSRPFCPY